MGESNSWLLELAADCRSAVGEFEMIHVLTIEPELFAITSAPSHCASAFLWQENVVPVMDLAAWLDGGAPCRKRSFLAITRNHDRGSDTTEYVALLLAGIPKRLRVSDAQACPLPSRQWEPLAISCFEHPIHGPVPILDLPKIYSTVLMPI